MRRSLIPFLLLLAAAGPSPSFTNGTFSGTIGVTGAATLSGGGTLTGSFAGGTFTGTTLTTPTINGGALSGTFTGAHTYSGATTLSGGGTLSGTFAGTPTMSGAWTFGSTVNVTGTATAGTLTSLGNVNVANGSNLYLVPGIVGLKWDGAASIQASHPFKAPSINAGESLAISPSSAAIPPAFYAQIGAFSGTVVGQSDLTRFSVSGDTANCTAAANGVCDTIGIYHNVGGAAVAGGRGAIWAQLNVGSGIVTPGLEMLGVSSTVFSSTPNSGAYLQALAANTVLNSGATGVGSIINEIDYAAFSGSSVGTKGGLQITLGTGDAVAGSTNDAGLIVTNANVFGVSSGMGAAIQIGADVQAWPVNPTTGAVLSAKLQTGNKGSGRNAQFVQPTALAGIDLGNVNTSLNSGYSFRGAGFAVDGTGQGTFGNGLLLATTSTGYKIDVPNAQVVTSIAAAVAGIATGDGLNNYFAGDVIFGTGTPSVGQYRITHTKLIAATVNAGGSGGVNGACTVTGTTGTGTKFQASGTITGGVLGGALSVSVAGDYTVNPTSMTAEPVTGCSLTGATLKLGMGALTVSVLVPDVFNACPGAGGITPTGGSGAGLTLTPTCTARSTIQLNATGGDTLIGSGSALATNATAGFPLIPSSAGAPTGTVANAAAGKVAIQIDTTNKKLCYSVGGGTWECSAAFTP